jgi:hypothetical protein
LEAILGEGCVATKTVIKAVKFQKEDGKESESVGWQDIA